MAGMPWSVAEPGQEGVAEATVAPSVLPAVDDEPCGAAYEHEPRNVPAGPHGDGGAPSPGFRRSPGFTCCRPV